MTVLGADNGYEQSLLGDITHVPSASALSGTVAMAVAIEQYGWWRSQGMSDNAIRSVLHDAIGYDRPLSSDLSVALAGVWIDCVSGRG